MMLTHEEKYRKCRRRAVKLTLNRSQITTNENQRCKHVDTSIQSIRTFFKYVMLRKCVRAETVACGPQPAISGSSASKLYKTKLDSVPYYM